MWLMGLIALVALPHIPRLQLPEKCAHLQGCFSFGTRAAAIGAFSAALYLASTFMCVSS
jgi:hypothetical protein